MEARDPICVFSPQNEWEGELMVQHLRANGIEAHLANRASVGLWGNGSLPLVKLEILVSQQQSHAASTLIDQFLTDQDEE